MKNSTRWLLCMAIACVMCTVQLCAQTFEPFSLRYQYIPETGITQPDDGGFTSSRRSASSVWDANLRFPVYRNERGTILLPEYQFKRYDQSFAHWPSAQDEPGNTYYQRLFFKGIFAVNDRWRLLVLGAVSNGWQEGASFQLSNNFYRGGLGFLIEKGIHQYGFSLLYIEEIQFVVPALVYKGASASGKWQFNIEAPQLSIAEYLLSKNTRLRFVERLDNERFMFRESENHPLHSFNNVNLSLTAGLATRVAGPVFFHASAGASFLNVLALQSERYSVEEGLLLEMSPAFSVGFYMSINPNER